jgi:hypothetical protein
MKALTIRQPWAWAVPPHAGWDRPSRPREDRGRPIARTLWEAS